MHHSDQLSIPHLLVDRLALLYQNPQAELDALDTVRQHHQDGLLTIDEAMCTMEGKQLWQLLATH